MSSSTMLGRLYGQGSEDVCWFDVAADLAGRPIIQVSVREPRTNTFCLPQGSSVLVQLFEQPDNLWLASAISLGGTHVIAYTPLESLESSDGGYPLPELEPVTLEQVDEAVCDAMSDREKW